MYLGILIPLSKSKAKLQKLNFLLKMRYFLNKWMEIHQT